ncbi:unnamed protein product [Symbiodinium sp. CCMP2592]|nr:unnamed protein product [Symbiodinium sp. CCMP2592]
MPTDADGPEHNQVGVDIVKERLSFVRKDRRENGREGVLVGVERSKGRAKAAEQRGKPKKLTGKTLNIPDVPGLKKLLTRLTQCDQTRGLGYGYEQEATADYGGETMWGHWRAQQEAPK